MAWAPAFVRGWSPGVASRCCDHVFGVFSCVDREAGVPRPARALRL